MAICGTCANYIYDEGYCTRLKTYYPPEDKACSYYECEALETPKETPLIFEKCQQHVCALAEHYKELVENCLSNNDNLSASTC